MDKKKLKRPKPIRDLMSGKIYQEFMAKKKARPEDVAKLPFVEDAEPRGQCGLKLVDRPCIIKKKD